MKIHLVYSGLIIAVISNGQCTTRGHKSNADHTSEKNVIISRMECMADSSHSYYIAVPEDFNIGKKWPLVVAFDPKGDGKLAVESMIGGAANNGYIIAGSNVIRNGYENPENAFRILFSDILNRYPVDPDRIYAAGFSGGGRYAQIFSQLNTSIKAIISMGAGFSLNPSEPIRNKVPMLFIAGNEDFNYLEIINSYGPLKRSGVRHYIFEFNGTHAWPDHSIINEALLWFEFDDCRRNKSRQDDPVIANYKRKVEENADRYLSGHDIYSAYKEYEKGIAMLSGLTNTRSMVKDMNKCKESPDYKNASERKNASINLESRLQQGYISALNRKDTIWWKNEISSLKQKIEKSEDPFLSDVYIRVKSFISIAAYSLTNISLKANDFPRAERIIGIYQIIDPGNPDVYYFKALYCSKMGQSQMAIRYFQKAADLGFTDLPRALQELPETIFYKVIDSI